jgi:hypothetical protein
MRGSLIWFWSLLFFYALFSSCTPPEQKKESLAVVINFFSPDTSNYPAVKNFPFPDFFEFAPLDVFFTNQNKAPVISDSTIIFYDNYRSNGQKLCCKEDTLKLFTDTINNKKYVFAVGEYIAVFVSDTNSTINLRPRRDQPLSLWGIQLNVPHPPERFSEDHEKLGAKFVKLDPRIDEVYRQKWNDNDSILVETIQYRNTFDRIVTKVYKDMDSTEADSTVNYFRKNFPYIIYKEVTQPADNGSQFRSIRMSLNGIVIAVDQTAADQYSFSMTDYYETIRLIIRNTGTGYVFRDDVLIH